jgi:hypothetical protein
MPTGREGTTDAPQSFRLGLPAPTVASNLFVEPLILYGTPSDVSTALPLPLPLDEGSYPLAAVEAPISPGAPTALWIGAGLGGPFP